MRTVRRPPPELLRTPVTSAMAMGAVLVTVLSKTGDSIDPLVLDHRAFWHEPWRLLTSILPHGGVLHLVFNLWGLWAIGRVIEEEWGSLRTLLLTMFLAAGSGAAELGLTGHPGIGLSGVGYGHFGFWWALSRYSHRYGNILDPSITKAYVSWFFLCIALTSLRVLPIANVAHGAGALLGGLVGYALARQDRRRIAAWGGALCAFAFGLVSASGSGPLWRGDGRASAVTEAEALIHTDPARAVAILRPAAERWPNDVLIWWRMAQALQQLERLDETRQALDQVLRLVPDEGSFRREARHWHEDLTRRIRLRDADRAHAASQPGAKKP